MEQEENVYEKTEQAQTAEAEEGRGATDLGKFKDVDALMKAYNALQAEFTRRSQRLRALESAADNSGGVERSKDVESSKENTTVSEGEKPEPVAADIPLVEGEEKISQRAKEEENEAKVVPMVQTNGINSFDLYEAVRADEQVRSRIIGEYLTSLSAGSAPLMRGGTGSPALSKKKATSFEEAGKMALSFFKSGEND